MGKKDIHLTTINPIIITTGLISNVKSRLCRLQLSGFEPSFFNALSTRHLRDPFEAIDKHDLHIPVRCFSRRTRFKILDYVGYGFDPVVITKQPARNGGAEIV
ncbi:hypothetical protein CEXT_133651 [Caerostris extrusa]|uniref:Uncharacterized protein n=1 Tax=Caerostris extrusa TaxID=172846 RepID=A0AAV4SHR0_CAEEX|nr:hypothetical protein CEXT_133651 [Caerostris extrusa]